MDEEKQLEVLDRGLVVLFSEPANPKVSTVLKNNDLNIDSHVATMLEAGDITEDTLILTMTRKQRDSVMEKFEEAKNVYAIKEFVGYEGDVMDPYGGTLLDYEGCFDELSKLVKKTIYKLGEED